MVVFTTPFALGFSLLHPPGPFKYTNPGFDATIDGAFSGGLLNGFPMGEWEGISPLVYDNRQAATTGTVVPINWLPGDTRGTVYAPVGLAHGPILHEFYGLLALTEYTNPCFLAASPGSTVAEVHLAGPSPGTLSLLRGNDPSQFDFYLNLANVIDSGKEAAEYGIEAAASFAQSPLSDSPHLVIEFSIPVSVPAGFGDTNSNGLLDDGEVFPPEGLTGLVEPGLQRLTASYVIEGVIIPAADMLVSFDQQGFATISANHLVVPEPGTIALISTALFAGVLAQPAFATLIRTQYKRTSRSRCPHQFRLFSRSGGFMRECRTPRDRWPVGRIQPELSGRHCRLRRLAKD